MKSKNLSVRSFAIILLSAGLLASCNSNNYKASGTGTVDTVTTASNSCINPQVLSMLGAKTNLSLAVENGKYTFSKELYSDEADSKTSSLTGKKVFDTKYTFTGTCTKKDNVYTLAPATGCEYTISWGVLSGLYEGATPTKDGTGTQATDATCLNYFYTPYLKINDNNTTSMNVTIKDGGLTFEGFTLVEVAE